MGKEDIDEITQSYKAESESRKGIEDTAKLVSCKVESLYSIKKGNNRENMPTITT